MAAKKVKVTYQGDPPRIEIVKVLPRATVMTEEHFNGMNSERAAAIGYHLGWASLVVLKKETLDYETWIDRIEDVEVYEDPEDPEATTDEIPPTQPDPTADASSE